MPTYDPLFLAKSDSLLKSYFLYEYRRWYREKTTEIFDNFNPNYIDLWYDVPFYGKINTLGRLVHPLKSKINYPAGSIQQGVNASGFDFSLKAIDELSFFLRRGVVGGKTKLSRLLNNFKIKSSFVDSREESTDNIVATFIAFNKLIVSNGDSEKITNFDKYSCEIVDFLEETEKKVSFFYNFSSIHTTIRSTALSFEFVLGDHDNDLTKNVFFKDPEFYKYVQTAANFGFRINKNAPWMLIVDPNSAPMLKGRKVKRGYSIAKKQKRVIDVPGYLQENFIVNLESFFNEYYTPVILDSFLDFKFSLITSYKRYTKRMRYVVDHGVVIVPEYTDFKEVSTKSFFRTPSMEKDIEIYNDKKYDDYYFLKKFEKVLKSEFKGNYNVREYNSFKNKFDKLINTKSTINSILILLEDFYSPIRIYNRNTRKLSWNSPKKPLTRKLAYASLQDKPQPAVENIVTEYMPDI